MGILRQVSWNFMTTVTAEEFCIHRTNSIRPTENCSMLTALFLSHECWYCQTMGSMGSSENNVKLSYLQMSQMLMSHRFQYHYNCKCTSIHWTHFNIKILNVLCIWRLKTMKRNHFYTKLLCQIEMAISVKV